MLSFRKLLFSCLMVLAVASTASASLTVKLTLPELSDASVAIVRGRVIAVDSAWDRAIDAIYTYVVVEVDEALKGDVPKRITIKQLGGLVDNIGLAISGTPEFSRGEEVLLFLEVRPRDLTLQTTVLWQGKWTVRRDLDANTPQAVRSAGDDIQGAPIGREQLALGEVEDAARLPSHASRIVPRDVVFNPPEAPRPGSNDQSADSRKAKFGYSWHETFRGTRIPVRYTDREQPGFLIGKGIGPIKTAFHRWDAIWQAIDIFTNGHKYTGSAVGFTDRGPSSVDVVVFNNDPNGEIGNRGHELARAGAYFDTTDKIRGLSRAFSGFLVVNDSEFAYSIMRGTTCYGNVLTHEMGHVAGINHLADPKALMYPVIEQGRCNVWAFPPHKPDRLVFREIYHRDYRQ